MQCPKCGWNNPDNAAKCANCFTEFKAAAPPQPTQQVPPPPQQQYGQQPYGQQPYGQQPYAQQPYAAGGYQTVPDYLVWSILVTLFCCIPFGIVAIVKAAAANSKKGIGDYYGAMQDSNAAKTWIWWAFGLGLAGNLLIVAIQILALVGSIGSRGFNP